MVSISLLSDNESAQEICNINETTYYLTSFAYLAALCTSACFIDDLTLVFGVLAGVSECIIVFILPSVFYYISVRKARIEAARTGKEDEVKRGEMQAVALFFALGICYFTLSNYFNIMKLRNL